MAYPVECIGTNYVIEGKTVPADKFVPGILYTGVPVYEVLRVRDKTPLFYDDHVERLFRSAKIAGATDFPPAIKVTETTRNLIEANNISEGNIRILLHFHEGIHGRQKLYGWFIPHHYPTQEEYADGITMVPVNTERHSLHSKIIDMDFRSFITEQVKKEKAYEALLVDRDGFFTEGSKSNFFMIKGNKVLTAPEKYVLPGITRKYVMDICMNTGIEIEERSIHCTEAGNFESCFISGTSPGVLPVRSIGPVKFSPGHPVIRKLMDEYESMITRHIEMNRSRFSE